MKIKYLYKNTQPHATRDSSIATVLSGFTETLSIDEAFVTIEQSETATPPFLIKAHLVTPGPDYVAEARDYTIPATLRKLAGEITHIIKTRQASRTRRLARNKTGAALGVKSSHRG